MPSSRDANGKLRRGTSNTNERGSAATRRKRKCWLLAWHGDGLVCLCYSCGKALVYSTLQADRIIPGRLGGTYARGNIRPACGDCNTRSGNAVKKALRDGVPIPEILRRCRLGLI